MMENIVKILKDIIRGLSDSIKGTFAIFYLDKNIKEKEAKGSPYCDQTKTKKSEATTPSKQANTKQEGGKILKRTLQCCGLNGGIFWFSILLFNHALLPLVKFILILIFGLSSDVGETAWSIISSFLSIVFSTFWVLPLMLLSKVVNSLWFQDIADSAYRYSRGRPQSLPSIGKLIADTCFSFIIQAAFLVQALLVNYFPVAPFGYLFALVHNCMLYSLYSFEYKMCNMGWELHKRLHFIESNWPYFIGFGLPLAVSTSLTDSCIISCCIFSILFPLFIISANEATPTTNVTYSRLALFSLVIALSNTVLHKTMSTASRDKRRTSAKSS